MRQSHIGGCTDTLFYLIEQALRHSRSFSSCRRRIVALWNVGHHIGGIEVAFAHFDKVDQDLWITTGKFYTFIEEHRCVAVRVKREYVCVYPFGRSERLCTLHKVTKERHHTVIIVK